MTKTKETETTVQIPAPKIRVLQLGITGTAPYVQLRFSEKAKGMMKDKMMLGGAAKGKKNRAARDFDEDFRQALYVSDDGWHGIPAPAFRNAMVSACRLVGFKMTLAKLSIFVPADGFDAFDKTPLIRIDGEPQPIESTVRNATGVADIRVRAQFYPWSATLKVRFDADQFTDVDVVNLMARVGLQVGIGEGRPDSKNSTGMGWGTFEVNQE